MKREQRNSKDFLQGTRAFGLGRQRLPKGTIHNIIHEVPIQHTVKASESVVKARDGKRWTKILEIKNLVKPIEKESATPSNKDRNILVRRASHGGLR